jgi:lipopolysaccharide/colanic/teichoic acid biosynthesis glycosyltransferase
VFDVTCSTLGLLLLLPLFALIGISIKLDSPGPVFFRQDRVGRHGRVFRIHKFRTMRVQASDTSLQVTVGADPRITGIGSWLRKYKLDELPQLIDVLSGHMSLVGPRPEVPRYIAWYPAAVRAKVLSVRPGITDWASVRFSEENALLASAPDPERAYVEVILPVKQRFYVEYVENRSFTEDLRILRATLATLLRRPRRQNAADSERTLPPSSRG